MALGGLKVREGDGTATRRESRLFALLAAEIIALNILWAPLSLDFAHFAFCDSGANFSLQYLIAHGYRPAIDFAYPYGLLPILLGRIWFAIAGATPFSLQALILVCELGIGLAFARISAALRFGKLSIAIILITLWFSIHPNYPSITHAAEALLLTLALSEQASGRQSRAVIYATAAIFAKPSMGYVYLVWLAAFWFWRTPRPQRRKLILPELIIPAAITGAGCAVLLSAVYGPLALIHTAFPLEGIAGYKELNFGFFTGSGRFFWNSSQNSLLSYVFGVSGLWILATLFLACAAAGAAKRTWLSPGDRDGPAKSRDEVILTCFALHAAFVCFFFGNQWSWFYYSYFLSIGVAAAADLGSVSRRAGFAVCCIGALSLLGSTLALLHDWNTRQPRAVTAWLWSPLKQADEWRHVLDLARGAHATILDTKGAAELMYPQFQPPVSLYLDRGLMRQSEVERKARQLANSELVVVPLGTPPCGGIPPAPEILAAMTKFDPLFSGRYFTVYRRTSVNPGAPDVRR
ncbi:MAG TPA: hypothetical protein VNF27_02590 [Candidatus Binataceae bacterium]|nr:hypothetical protein [Candidatus Binataceae bacterium]